MDSYTHDTKSWLDQRFKMTDEDRIYFPHQPIFGFRNSHSKPGEVNKYITTYQIMKALSHLKFTSLLDVGGAEGYQAALVRSIFNVSVRSVDLSWEACKRAKEIFNIDGESVDIHQLPYNDNEFDVVVCSETLEHVSNIQRATRELIRVCRKAVVITVPYDPKEVIENNIRSKEPHAHIHCLDTDSFDFVLPAVSKVISRRSLTPILRYVTFLASAETGEPWRFPQFQKLYNSSLPLFRLIFGMRLVGMLIKLDDYIANLIPRYAGMLFTILKDASCYEAHQEKPVSVPQIIDFKVPYHYL